jgi:hypothetical protein
MDLEKLQKLQFYLCISDRYNMENLIKKVERNNHLQHLVNIAPLIVFAYGIQCWMIATFFPDQKLSHFCMPLAIALVVMLSALVIYDSFSHFEMFESHLKIRFAPLGKTKTINYSDIKDVEILDAEASFTNIVIRMHDDSYKLVYFIDEAVAIKELIAKLSAQKEQEDQMDPPTQIAA